MPKTPRALIKELEEYLHNNPKWNQDHIYVYEYESDKPDSAVRILKGMIAQDPYCCGIQHVGYLYAFTLDTTFLKEYRIYNNRELSISHFISMYNTGFQPDSKITFNLFYKWLCTLAKRRLWYRLQATDIIIDHNAPMTKNLFDKLVELKLATVEDEFINPNTRNKCRVYIVNKDNSHYETYFKPLCQQHP